MNNRNDTEDYRTISSHCMHTYILFPILVSTIQNDLINWGNKKLEFIRGQVKKTNTNQC